MFTHCIAPQGSNGLSASALSRPAQTSLRFRLRAGAAWLAAVFAAGSTFAQGYLGSVTPVTPAPALSTNVVVTTNFTTTTNLVLTTNAQIRTNLTLVTNAVVNTTPAISSNAVTTTQTRVQTNSAIITQPVVDRKSTRLNSSHT